MARPAKFTTDEILDASRGLVIESGPAAMTMTAVAGRLSAPSGSLYHRFAGRDDLAAALWLRCVERFQDGYLAALGASRPLDAALRAAQHVVAWSRTNSDDAQILLLLRSGDLLHRTWPDGLRNHNLDLQRRLSRGLSNLESAFGATDDDARHRVRFAVVDVPYAAVRPSLLAGRTPPRSTDALVAETVSLVLGPLVADDQRTDDGHDG